MSDAARALAVGIEPLGFGFAPTPCLDSVGHIAHSLAQGGEFRCAANRLLGGCRQHFAPADETGPANYLVERPTHLPAQVARHARRSDSEDEQCEHRKNADDAYRPPGEKAVAPCLLERRSELAFVRVDKLSLGAV